MLDDFWTPDAVAETDTQELSRQHTVACRCGKHMRVKRKHFGRMCRCTHCRFPIYVTYENVDPPVGPDERHIPRVFKADEVPVHWQKGDLLMELYEVRDTLGEGGMGVVYQVYHRGWGKQLAVKSPSARLLDDEEWISQFEHECETWINLPPHPHVVECYYVRRLGGIPRVFVEYVKGKDLGALIDSKALYAGGPDSVMKRILDAAIQFCWGLYHAHYHGVIHQDVKPGNLVMSEGDQCKVTDFGLAKVWVSDESPGSGGSGGTPVDRMRIKGLSGGTPTYRSPDHKIYGEVTHKTDIWSWGVSMIEIFSGDVYWRQGSKAKSVLDDLLHHGSRYDVVPKMPKRLQDLLYRCFQDNPDDRPANMKVIADELREIYKESTGKAYARQEPAISDMSIDVLNNRAVSYLDLGKMDEAELLWEQALEKDPARIEPEYNRHLNFWKHGHITDSQMVELMYQLADEHKDDWLPSYLLSRVLIERGDAALGLKVLENVRQTDANKREINFGLAMAQNYLRLDRKLVWEYLPGTMKVTAVALSFDGWRVATGGLDGQARIWEMTSRQCTSVLNGHTDRIYSITMSEDERRALTASADKSLRLWDPMNGKSLQTFKAHLGPVRSGVLSGEGEFVLSGSDDGALILWSTSTGKPVRAFKGHTAGVNQVAMSRCGRFGYSASSDKTLKKWDIASGRCLMSFEGSEDRVTGLSLSSDGAMLVSCSDKFIHTWDTLTGAMTQAIRGHTQEIFSVALGESGRYAVSATGLGTLKVWDVRTGQCLRSFQGHAPLSLSRDGQYAISCGKHGEFKVWAVHIVDTPFPAQFALCKGV
jgi:serine/threonine protein kinase